MTPPTPRRRRAGLRIALLGVLASLCASFAGVGTAGAQQRHVVVVGDSVILGAQSAMVGAFNGAGWSISFDAAVNRSTAAGAAAIDGHAMELTDTLVINLGANDAGNTGAYRQRIEQIFAATASVPHVYWLTIREVRDYYPAANQTLREAAAAHPNVTVLDWHGVTVGRTDLTSSDGLHLNGAGAAAMTDLVTGAAFNGVVPAPAAPAPAATLPPQTAPPETAPPVTDAPTTVPTTLAIETTTTLAPTTTSTAPTTTTASGRVDRAVTQDAALAAEQVNDDGNVVSRTLGGGVAVVVVLLALGGAALGGWALVGTRGRPGPASPRTVADPVDPPENHPSGTHQS